MTSLKKRVTSRSGDWGRGVGKQDQYAAGFGGLTGLKSDTAGEVAVRHSVCQSRRFTTWRSG